METTKSNGSVRLEEALATLIQNQAAFVGQMAETNKRIAEVDRIYSQRAAETERINSERFARIEALLLEHNRMLLDHNRILEALPEAIREKIGFKSSP